YLLYTADDIVADERMIGVIALGREWQTHHRFLVSWSPFVALFLAEGVAQLPRPRWQLIFGTGLAMVLLAQATVWRGTFRLTKVNNILALPGEEVPPFLPPAARNLKSAAVDK